MMKNKKVSVVLARLAGVLAIACMIAVSTANADTIYKYDRTIVLPAIGPSYAAGTMPSNASGAKGIHFTNGLLYVAQNSAEVVSVVDPSDDSIVRTIENTQPSGTSMSNLVDVWADGCGNVWVVSDMGTDMTILYADSDDTTLTPGFTLPGGRAYAVAKDCTGNFYFVDPGGPLAICDCNGNLLSSYSYDCYGAMDVTADGSTVYMGGRYSTGSELDKKLYSVDTSDGSSTILSASHENTAEAMGLCVDETNGYAYMAIRRTSATGDNCVIKYDLAGNELARWNQWDPATGAVSYDSSNGGYDDNGMDQVFGVAVDPDTGTVYVARSKVYDSLGTGQYCSEVMVFSVVPEPGTLALLATGLFGLLAYAYRKRN